MGIEISASGFNAALRRQDVVANNIANAQTPGYQRLQAGDGVVRVDKTPGVPEGSNVDLAVEITSSQINVRDAQANAGVFRVQDRLTGETLDLLA